MQLISAVWKQSVYLKNLFDCSFLFAVDIDVFVWSEVKCAKCNPETRDQ